MLVPVAALACGSIDHGGKGWHPVHVQHIPPMTTNRFWNSVAAVVLLFMIYAAGIAAGKDAVVQTHHNHPACHQNLKP